MNGKARRTRPSSNDDGFPGNAKGPAPPAISTVGHPPPPNERLVLVTPTEVESTLNGSATARLQPACNEAAQPNSLSLTDDEREETCALIEQVRRQHDRPVTDKFFDYIDDLAVHLPKRLRLAVMEFRRRPNATGTLLIRNLPVWPVGPTPANGLLRPDGNTWRAERLAMMIASLHGYIFSYADEKNGQMPQAVAPVPGDADEQTNGSTTNFGWHTENNALRPVQPLGIILHCLRQDAAKQAETITASIHEAVSLLAKPVVKILLEPHFMVQLPISIAPDAEPLITSALDDSGSYLRLNFHETRMSVSPDSKKPAAARAALCELLQALNSVQRSVRLEPGSLIIVANDFCVHGRSAFHASYDGSDRFLIRVYTHGHWEQLQNWCRPGTRLVVPADIVVAER
jgi:L-asparagine oxygenase